MKALLTSALVFTATVAVHAEWRQIFVPVADKAELTRLAGVLGGFDPCGTLISEAGVDLPVETADYERLVSAGFLPEVLIPDLEAHYAERVGASRNYGAYHTYSEGMAEIQQLHLDFPSIVSLPISIGTTDEGNTIWALKISDNPEVDEDEPEVFYNSYIHAREAITIEVLLHFMHHLTDNYGTDERVTGIVDGRELWFVPFMNPDGVLYNEATNPNGGGMWRKNRTDNGDGSYGTDLNRNFGYEWGFDNAGSSPIPSEITYRGPSAFSELETQAVRSFVNDREFASSITYHSYSNLLIYPWGYDELHVPEPDHSAFVSMTGQMAAINGYSPGTAWELLYTTNGDSDDWLYGASDEHGPIFAITPEVGGSGDGFWPSESRIPTLVAENLEPNLLFAEMAGNPWSTLPPATPTLDAIGAVGADYLVSWTTPAPDAHNPATAYALRELAGLTVGTDAFADESNWEPGATAFALSSSRSASPPTSYYGGTGDNRNAISRLAQAIDVQPGDAIEMQIWYTIESNWDYAYVEVSLDGASWQSIPGNVTTTSNPNGNNDGHGITGSSGGWVAASFPLDAWAGQSLFVRLRYQTDANTLGEGVYVDDFSPAAAFASETLLADDIAGESYAVTGQESGEYWYQVRAVDGDGDWSSWSPAELAVVTGGPDLSPPQIAHAGLPDTGNAAGPWTVTAQIADPSGVASASLEHRIDGGAWQAVAMAPAREAWTADIPGPAAWSSLVEYRILATDASENANAGESGIFGFTILPPAGLEYCQDFEAGLDDFTVEVYDALGNGWTTSTYTGQGGTAYASYSDAGQEDHAALISPAFDCSEQGTVRLDFWHHLRMGYAGAWTDAYVRGSNDGGASWPYLLGEWHEDDQAGEFVVEGANQLDISSWAAGRSDVRVLFEFHDLYDWYWHVDDVCLTGTLAEQPDPVELRIALAGANGVALAWDEVAHALTYDVYAGEYGALTLVASVTEPSWTDAIGGLGQRYYQVVARTSALLEDASVPSIDPAANRRAASPLDKLVP